MTADDPPPRDRAAGVLFGLACGDALGRPVEGLSPRAIAREYGELSEMVGDGVHGRPPGTVTDDTELALCVARALVDRGGFDGPTVAREFTEWWATDPDTAGSTTSEVLDALENGAPWHEAGAAVWSDRREGYNAGNGSVMRCGPYALAFPRDDNQRAYVSRQSSAITHADPRCTNGCAILTGTVARLLRGASAPLGKTLSALGRYRLPDELVAALEPIPRDLCESDVTNGGYVVDALQAGLYYGLTRPSAERAITDAVNAGGDADTVGAITGTVAGARFGASALPESWIESLDVAAELRTLATALLDCRAYAPAEPHDSPVPDRPADAVSAERPTIDLRPDPDHTTTEGTPLLHGRTVSGATYVPANDRAQPPAGHRPDPAPADVVGVCPRRYSPVEAAMADWERRAYLSSDRSPTSFGQPDATPDDTGPTLVRVPEYHLADRVEDLPPADRERVRSLADRVETAVERTTDRVEDCYDLVDRIPDEQGLYRNGQAQSHLRESLVDLNFPVADDPWTPVPDPADAAASLHEVRDTLATFLDVALRGVDGEDHAADLTRAAEAALGVVTTALAALDAWAVRHPEVRLSETGWD